MDEVTQKVVDGTAWREFCDLLAEAGASVLAEGNPDDPLDRAEGFRMLTRLLRGALETHLEHYQSAYPQLICTCHETIKIVGENPDNHYLGASIDGRFDYRVWGTRGQAKWISFNLFSGAGFGGGGPGTGSTLHEEQMHIEDDGTFEVIISQHEHPGNWLRSEPETRSLALRQTFLDKRHQDHADLHIERIGSDGSAPEPLTPADLYRSLLIAGHYVKAVSAIGAQWAVRQSRWPNVFTDEAEDDLTDKFKDPQIKWHQAYFDLARRRGPCGGGHAAGVRILDVRPPQPLDGDTRLRPPPGHAQLPFGPTAAGWQRTSGRGPPGSRTAELARYRWSLPRHGGSALGRARCGGRPPGHPGGQTRRSCLSTVGGLTPPDSAISSTFGT